MTDSETAQQQNLRQLLQPLERRIARLTVAVVLLALAVFLVAATVFGDLVNYMAGDPLLYGGSTAGAALLGFGFGWFAGRRC